MAVGYAVNTPTQLTPDIYGAATQIRRPASTADSTVRHEPTRVVELFMAGDVDHAKQVARRFCRDVPCCVTVTPTAYVYTGGEEAGFVIAADLADRLRDALGQSSWLLVDASGMTTWSTVNA
jgi:hypothetical protein